MAGLGLLELTLRLTAGVLLILVNAFLVAVEFGLTRARQYPKEEFVDSGHRGLEKAWEMTEELEIYLTSCQVGISATSIALGVIAEPALASLLNPLFEGTVFASFGAGVFLAFLIINLVHLTHGEQTPTYLGVEKSKMVCKYGAIPLYWYTKVIRPLITMGDSVAKFTLRLFNIEMTSSWVETGEETIKSRSQLHTKLQSMLQTQDLSNEHINEVLSTLDADKLQLRDVMVSKEEIKTISTENTIEENKQILQDSAHSRYPLIGSSLKEIHGIVYVASLARELYGVKDEAVNLQEIAVPALKFKDTMSIGQAIDTFQQEQQEIAFVVDETDTVVGIVTITDLLEQFVGEIEDPLDLE